jgi:AcrR family transcriptional regulator
MARAAAAEGRSAPTSPRSGPGSAGTKTAEAIGQVVHHLGTTDLSAPRVRVVDATLRCLARQGIHKTALDEVAKEAGVSRATLYRLFPGGRDAVLAAVVETEVARLCSALAVAMGEAQDLEEVLVSGMVEAAGRLAGHPALHYLLEHEPGSVLPHLAFGQMDQVLLAASDFAAPFFARWLEPDQALRAGEWATRIVFSYVANPSSHTDLTNLDDARHVVTTFVLPGLQALRQEDESSRQRGAHTRASRRKRPRGASRSTARSSPQRASKTDQHGGDER